VKYNYLKLSMMNNKNNKNDNKLEPVQWVVGFTTICMMSSTQVESGSV